MAKVLSDHQESELFLGVRGDVEINLMLDKAEKERNNWLFRYYKVKSNQRKAIECLRNIKALEGVIKTLKWVLGSKEIDHPLN
jgi:hypothetical protein